MLSFIYNGDLYNEDRLLAGPANRGLKYGDGLFETMKSVEDKIILFDEHIARLWKGLKTLRISIPEYFTPAYISHQAYRLLKKNNDRHARVRITIARGDGGLLSGIDSFNFIIQSHPIDKYNAELNESGFKLCIYRDAKKSIDTFSNLKHNNFLPYLMGAIHARTQKCDDAIILNSAIRVCETSVANIFLTVGKQIFTVDLSEGCIAGVMRAEIIKTLGRCNLKVTESPVTEEMLLNADEIFLSNSIYNIRWVTAIENRKFSGSGVNKIYSLLKETNPEVFC